ncbi:unnamed protein product [Larinioides sclopetarius]|uniref:TIL domain-containing protein n=1 Tax=Larinioides sclopetarius TaxID=280406 RepID=A0AAV2BWU6_9ARAC
MASLLHLFLSLLGLSIRHQPIPSTDVSVISTQCGANEHYVTCVNQCNKCVEPPPEECSGICTSGCDCLPGYTRNESSVCVPKEQCAKSVGCPVNEGQSNCVVYCNDCKRRGQCTLFICYKGCDCLEGYFRNNDRKCVPAAECSTKNEKVDTHMGGCIEARCAAFCQGYGKRGNCKEAYPGGEKLCLCSK